MNELLRLIQKSLRPFGYDIRKRGTYNLLPFKSLETFPDLDQMRADLEYNGGGERKAESNLDHLKIIARTCIRDDRNVKAHNALTQASLEETITRCLRSLVVSVNAALREPAKPQITVIVLDDHSDALYVEKIRGILQPLNCHWSIETTATRGQGASLHEQFTRAKGDDALYYFCEDDYLHEESAVHEMWAFYKHIYTFTRRHLVLHPQESESMYGSAHYPSYLLLSPTRHWRTASHATHVLFTHGHVVRDEWDCFENTKYVGNKKKRRLGSESRTTNRLFDKMPCLVPIPALAGHLQLAQSLPPFFDWRKLWDRNK